MIEKLVGKCESHGLALLTDVTYSQVVYWFENSMRPMKMSLILPKARPYESPRPLIVWLCGGGFKSMDKDVWIPQLMYFAQHGFTVASIQYRTSNEGVFPDPIVDIKAAIRYLRAHAKDFFVDPDRIVLGGESAGACLSLLAAASDGISVFEQGDYLDQPSNVQALLDFYGTAYLDYQNDIYPGGKQYDIGDPSIELGQVSTMLSSKMPPVFIVHGDKDPFVPIEDSYKLHERPQELNVPCEMLHFEGSGHGADEFYQTAVYDRIIEFLKKVLP
jgi:acetyl esterase/lipase